MTDLTKVDCCFAINGIRSCHFEINRVLPTSEVDKLKEQLCRDYNKDIYLITGHPDSEYKPPDMLPLSELKRAEKKNKKFYA